MVCEKRSIGGLLPEQRAAADHRRGHARLLAGPGTGKTLTLVERVLGLINDGTSPDRILCLTFTRAAAAGFRKRVTDALGSGSDLPEIYTLHAFALRQLMKRYADIGSGKGNARVADDWEERFVVKEDLARILSSDIPDITRRLAALNAAWETTPGVVPTVDPPLLGALQQDKGRYHYVLRGELVFDLFREMGSDPAMLRGEYDYVIVDEYQDLNRCDVAVLDLMAERGAQLYVAGDDDQSIYEQLRHAHPQAIRDFPKVHSGSDDLRLSTCVRSDKAIVELGQEVISGEPGRTTKVLEPLSNAGSGLVEILSFDDQVAEARGIATLSRAFVDVGVPEDQIMVLLRSDHQGRMSEVIEDAFNRLRVPSIVRTAEKSALGTKAGRALLAHLHLALRPLDDLAWRSLLDCSRNGIGVRTIEAIETVGDSLSTSFAGAVAAVARDPHLVRRGSVVKNEYDEISARLATVSASGFADVESIITALQARLPRTDELDEAVSELLGLARSYAIAADLADFLTAIALRKEEEQALVPNTVNIMTMHKAKGLDACVVFVPAAEEEMYIRNESGRHEARRLFYVSVTRARHALFVTHATRRTGSQSRLGTNVRGPRRRTSFLMTRGGSMAGAAYTRTFKADPAVLSPPPPES